MTGGLENSRTPLGYSPRFTSWTNVRDLGASGDGVNDDTSFVLEAISRTAANGEGTVYFPAGTYVLTEELNLPDGVRLHSDDGAVLSFAGAAAGNFPDNACIYSEGSLGAEPDLNANVAAGDVQITLAATHTFAVGDVGVIYDPTNGSYNPAQNEYRAGEFFRVVAVAGNTLTLDAPLFAPYVAATVDVFKLNGNRVGVSGLDVRGIGTTGTISVIVFALCSQAFVRDCVLSGSGHSMATCRRSFDVQFSGLNITEHQTNVGLNYGVSVINSQRVLVENCDISVTRHAVTHGGRDEIACIPNRDSLTSGCNLYGAEIAAWDSHGNAEYVTVADCNIRGGIIVGGDRVTVRNNDIRSGALLGRAMIFNDLIGVDHTIQGNRFTASMDVDVAASFLIEWDQTEVAAGEGPRLTRTGGTLRFEGNEVDMRSFDGDPINIRKRMTVSDVNMRITQNVIKRDAQSFTEGQCLFNGFVVGVTSHWREIVIEGNVFHNTGARVEDACTQRCTFIGNVVSGAPAQGFLYTGDASVAWDSETVLVQDNMIEDSGKAGIHVVGSDVTLTVTQCKNNVSLRNGQAATGITIDLSSISIDTVLRAIMRDNLCGDDQAVTTQTRAWVADTITLFEQERNGVIGTITTVTRTAITKEIAHYQDDPTRVVAYGTAAPVAGTWVQGDRVWNTAPAAAGTPGWVCTTGGTPGTWKAMANVAA